MNAFQSVSNQLTLVLSRGRIFEETLPLLKAVGVEVTEDPETLRKLILPVSDPTLRMITMRASDVLAYVRYGAADFGVAGRDVLTECGMTGLYTPIDLNIARCRMPVTVSKDFDYTNVVRQGACLSVATKHLSVVCEYFAKKGVYVDLIRLYGSMELGPLVGLADAIVGLINAGGTLHVNSLVEVEEVVQISSRLIVNQAALKLRHDRLASILDAFECTSVTDICVGEAT